MSWSVLPWDLTSFVGRSQERQALLEMASAAGPAPCLVSLYGMAGVGKTRLARVASSDMVEHFPGGRFYCELGDRPDAAAEVLARLLGEDTTSASEDLVERTALALTRRERSLIVLDHAGARESELLAVLPTWLSAGSHMFIVTAQAPLQLRGVRRMALAPLDAASCCQLLDDRVSELGIAMPPSRAETDSLLAFVGGSPLAIELMAGALGIRSPREIQAALSRGEAILHTAAADVPRRHQSLELALEDTWKDLSDSERRALSLACAFEERFHADDFARAATLLAGSHESDTTLTLAPLIARGLVARANDGLEILAILRRFVRARVQADRVQLAMAHAQVIRGLALAGEVRGDDLVRAADEMFACASDAARAEQATEVLLASSSALEIRGPIRLRREMLDRAMQLAERFDLPALRAQIALEEARVARARGDAAAARALLATIDPTKHAIAPWHYHLTDALVTLDLGHIEEARTTLALALQAATSPVERAHVMATSFAIDLVGSEACDEGDGLSAWSIFDDHGLTRPANKVMVNLALGSLHRGDHHVAMSRIRSALQGARSDGDRVVQAGCLLFRGLAEIDSGLDAQAIESLVEAEALALDLGRRSLWSDAVGYGAIARILAGDSDGLAQLASHVGDLEVFGGSGSGALFSAVLRALAWQGAPEKSVAGHGRPLVAQAVAILEGGGTSAEVYGVQARIARRIRESIKAGAPRADREVVKIARDGSRFARSASEVDLRRRGPLRNILAALVEQRLQAAGALAPEELVAAGWPLEVIQPEAAKTRLYNAIGSLRSLGLRGVIATSAQGYSLDGEINLEILDAC